MKGSIGTDFESAIFDLKNGFYCSPLNVEMRRDDLKFKNLYELLDFISENLIIYRMKTTFTCKGDVVCVPDLVHIVRRVHLDILHIEILWLYESFDSGSLNECVHKHSLNDEVWKPAILTGEYMSSKWVTNESLFGLLNYFIDRFQKLNH